jgi:hypothetical protein
MVIMTDRPTPPLVKTETAADYVQRHARNPLTRAHAADVQQAIAACRATDDPVDAATALIGLLATVAECAGSGWLKANSDDPDVARFTRLVENAAEPSPADGSPDASDLDELLPPFSGPPTGHSDHRAGLRNIKQANDQRLKSGETTR